MRLDIVLIENNTIVKETIKAIKDILNISDMDLLVDLALEEKLEKILESNSEQVEDDFIQKEHYIVVDCLEKEIIKIAKSGDLKGISKLGNKKIDKNEEKELLEDIKALAAELADRIGEAG